MALNSYQERKESARQKAIEWQENFSEHGYSYEELVSWQDFFTKLGKRYGLTEEFRENAII